MEEKCANCKNIDLQKKKEKFDSAGNKTTLYWCNARKQYIQIDLFICNKYKYERDILEFISEHSENSVK